MKLECLEVFRVFQGFKDFTVEFGFQVDFAFSSISEAKPNRMSFDVACV